MLMTTRPATQPETAVRSRRAIGRWGTAARLLVGVLLLADVAFGHIASGFHPAAWVLGLVGFPAILLVAHGCAPAAASRRCAPPGQPGTP